MEKVDKGVYVFEVKEGEASASGRDDALVSLYYQPTTSELSIVGSGFLSINLKRGTTVQQAAAIAQYLAEHIDSISYTG
ncbi:hypothetical protein ACFQ3P_43380 [Paraburkholderia sabiae]|uniref:Uncharacterized protein n=1 Tax=Paraburkholderia sabiae TaxID=273251 RepID=A0ABU9QSQ7_9BURK|nr:hypothetical protein [Paraburkholderia sabiae]WJZ80001.1 hypothetical protein QEN71_43430 [Paraburkholderia sabiae]CAD6563375.1 hypothetical protein LMG24235_08619 [Paraburkholderia sabiae]